MDECAEELARKDPKVRETKSNIVLKDVMDNYCIFGRLEQYLHQPPRLKEQLLFQIQSEDADRLIETYICFHYIIH